MNIEQIAVCIKDSHGLDMSDEAAITLLRHALSKLAEQSGVEPSCWMTPDGEGWRMRTEPPVNDVPLGWTAMYQETQLLAAQQRTAEACAKVCSMEAWAVDAMDSIRNGDWREYL